MSIATLILGETGTGKSRSLLNLDPTNVLLIKAINKVLPFKEKQMGWELATKENPSGSIFLADKSQNIVMAMERTKKQIIIIDDFQYTMSNEFMRRVLDKESGNAAFQKYNEIAKAAWDIVKMSGELTDNKRVYILSHTNTDDNGLIKIKTIGKLLDEKITIEGLFTIVLRTHRINGKYVMSTKNSGNDTVKSPEGLFEEEHIDNDLKMIDQKICEYYDIIH
jgi:hypothetical protein